MVFYIGIFVLVFSVGILRVQFEMGKTDPLSDFNSKEVLVSSVVSSETNESTFYKNFSVKVREVNGVKIESPYEVLVRTSSKDTFYIGDKIKVSGILSVPENFENESGIAFDYRGYLLQDNITFIIEKAKVEKTGYFERGLVRTLVSVKNSFLSNIDNVFNFPESALLSGLLVGTKQALGDSYLEMFRRAGVSHIIVLSGFNIAIVALMIMAITSPLPRVFRFVCSIIAIVMFGIMVGGDATVVRATIMVLIALFGKFIGRTYNALRALLIAGFIMIMFNPYILLHDVSFELSFMATLGLIIISPVIMPYFRLLPERFGIKEIIVSTIAVEILVIPLILYKMGAVSVVSLFSNLLILPVIAPTMLFGFLSGLVAYVFPSLSILVGYPAYILLKYEMFVVKIMAGFNFALYEIKELQLWFVILIYIAIGIGILYLKKVNKEREEIVFQSKKAL